METVGLQERLREPEMVEGMRQQRMIGRDAFPALRELI